MKYETWEIWFGVSVVIGISTYCLGYLQWVAFINLATCLAFGLKRYD